MNRPMMEPRRWDQARGFLEHHARRLDWALLRFRFEEGEANDVLEALAAFANPDGGFGHALEPDVRTPSSSALATALALRILDELDSSEADGLIRSAVRFFVASLEANTLVWRPVPEDVNNYPHAPWWHDEDGSLANTFDSFRIIPRALIVALLHRHRDAVPSDWLDRLTEATLLAVDAVGVLGEGGGSDLEYVSALAQTAGIPDQVRLAARVRRDVVRAVARDPAKWTTYCITPLRAVPTPNAPGADLIRDLVDHHVRVVLDTQNEEGCWNPTWSWFGAYPETWEVAMREWQGVLTLETLTSLRAYGYA